MPSPSTTTASGRITRTGFSAGTSGSIDDLNLNDQYASAEKHDGLLRQRNLLINTSYHGVHQYQTTPFSQGYGTHCEYLFIL